MSHIYRIKQLDLSKWRTAENCLFDSRRDIHQFVAAALFIKKRMPSMSTWEGEGDYWLAPLPMANQCIVIIRLYSNPFAEALLVSPIAFDELEEVFELDELM